MTYYAQPIITKFNEIAPRDAVSIPAVTFDASHSLPAMTWMAERAPLYDSSHLTNPANAIYIAPTTAFVAPGSDTTGKGTAAEPFATVSKARSYIDNTVKKATWIICAEGNYRDKWNTTFGDQSTFVLGVKAAAGAKVWFDGSDFLTGGTWSHSGNVWTWSGAFSPTVNAADQQVFLDGVPLIKTTNSSPGLGAFYTSGTTLKIGSTVDPSTKVIEFSNRNAPVAAIKKNGFYIGYVGFRRYSSGTTLFMNGANQQLDHVVLAYGNGTGYLLNTSGTNKLNMTEVVLTHGAMGKAWTDDGKSQDMSVSGMRVWGTNWRHTHNTAPSNSASLGGVKHWKSDGFRGEDMLFGWNVSNGEWNDGSDVGDPSQDNRTVRVTYWFNGGYGETTEVASTREVADVLAIGNGWMGFGNTDGLRWSGVEKAKGYAITSLDNVGAAVALYEDGREYQGSATNFRQLQPPGCGDSYACELKGAVMVRTQRVGANGVTTGTKPPFFSYCQSGDKTMAGSKESGSTGFCQTKPLSTAQMFSNDPNASTLVTTAHGKNVYVDTKGVTSIAKVAAPGAGAHWTLAYNAGGQVVATDVGGCSTQAAKTLAQMQSLGLDTGSVAVTTAGKSIGDYFPNAGPTGGPGEPADNGTSYTWWGLTAIPSTGTPGTTIPTYDPPDWACDALGVSRGSTVVAGCRRAPVPQEIGGGGGGGGGGSIPDIAVLLTPADGDTVSGSSVAVTAQGHDPDDNHAITVEIRADGNPIGAGFNLVYAGTGDDWAGTFDSTKLSDGNHDLRVRVTDTDSNFKSSTKHTVTVNNGADTDGPTVSGLTLSDGAIIKQPTVISATVTDTSGVQSVKARVIDAAGNTFDFTMT